MKVAEIGITHGSHIGPSAIASVGFETIGAATLEFERLKDYIKRHSERANDVDKTIVVAGINSFSCAGHNIIAITLVDYALEEKHLTGMRDAFPNVFKR